MNCGSPKLNKKDKAVMGLIGLAQIAVVALKVGGIIRLHWILVLFPTLFVIAIFVAVIAVAIFRLLFDDY